MPQGIPGAKSFSRAAGSITGRPPPLGLGVMAKRKSQQRTQIVRAVQVRPTPAPIIKVSAPRAAPVRRRRGGGRRRSSGGGASGALTQQTLISAGIGGAGFGFLIKSFPSLPTIPILGKAGTVALLALVAGKRIPFARDIGIAAAAIAGYQLGTEGHVLGEVVPQVRGVAAQV